MNQETGQKSQQSNQQMRNQLSQGHPQQQSQGELFSKQDPGSGLINQGQWQQPSNGGGAGQIYANDQFQNNQFLQQNQNMPFDYMNHQNQSQQMESQNMVQQDPSMTQLPVPIENNQALDNQGISQSQHHSQMMSQPNQMSANFNQVSYHQNSNSKKNLNSQMQMPEPTFGTNNQLPPIQEILHQTNQTEQNNSGVQMAEMNNTSQMQNQSAPQLPNNGETGEHQDFLPFQQNQDNAQQQNVAVANSHILGSGEEEEQERMDESVNESNQDSQKNIEMHNPINADVKSDDSEIKNSDQDDQSHEKIDDVQDSHEKSDISDDNESEDEVNSLKKFHTAYDVQNISQRQPVENRSNKSSVSRRSSSVRRGNEDDFQSAEQIEDSADNGSVKGPVPIAPSQTVEGRNSVAGRSHFKQQLEAEIGSRTRRGKKSATPIVPDSSEDDNSMGGPLPILEGSTRGGRQSVVMARGKTNAISEAIETDLIQKLRKGKQSARLPGDDKSLESEENQSVPVSGRGRGRGRASSRGRGRGRPSKASMQEIQPDVESEMQSVQQTKSKRGRKPKNVSEGKVTASKASTTGRKRGRPRKQVEQIQEQGSSQEKNSDNQIQQENLPCLSDDNDEISKNEAKPVSVDGDKEMASAHKETEQKSEKQDQSDKSSGAQQSESENSQIPVENKQSDSPKDSSSKQEPSSDDNDSNEDADMNNASEQSEPKSSHQVVDDDQTEQEESSDKQDAEDQKSIEQHEDSDSKDNQLNQTESNPTEQEQDQHSKFPEMSDKDEESNDKDGDKNIDEQSQESHSENEVVSDDHDHDLDQQSDKKSSENQELVPPHAQVSDEDDEMVEHILSSDDKDDDDEACPQSPQFEEDVQKASEEEESSSEVAMKFSDQKRAQYKPDDQEEPSEGQEKSVDAGQEDEDVQIQENENQVKTDNEVSSIRDEDMEEFQIPSVKNEKKDQEMTEVEIGEIGDDEEEEEGEYIPRTCSEKSNDHIIDENVESEVIAYHNQQSSEEQSDLKNINQNENEKEDQPGDESSSEEEQILQNTQKSAVSKNTQVSKESQKILSQTLSVAKSAAKQSQVTRRSASVAKTPVKTPAKLPAKQTPSRTPAKTPAKTPVKTPTRALASNTRVKSPIAPKSPSPVMLSAKKEQVRKSPMKRGQSPSPVQEISPKHVQKKASPVIKKAPAKTKTAAVAPQWPERRVSRRHQAAEVIKVPEAVKRAPSKQPNQKKETTKPSRQPAQDKQPVKALQRKASPVMPEPRQTRRSVVAPPMPAPQKVKDVKPIKQDAKASKKQSTPKEIKPAVKSVSIKKAESGLGSKTSRRLNKLSPVKADTVSKPSKSKSTRNKSVEDVKMDQQKQVSNKVVKHSLLESLSQKRDAILNKQLPSLSSKRTQDQKQEKKQQKEKAILSPRKTRQAVVQSTTTRQIKTNEIQKMDKSKSKDELNGSKQESVKDLANKQTTKIELNKIKTSKSSVVASARLSKSKIVKQTSSYEEVDKNTSSLGFGLGFSSPSPIKDNENESKNKRGRPRKFMVDDVPLRKPKISKTEIETKKVMDMIFPIIAEAKMNTPTQFVKKPKKEEMGKPRPVFGMIDEPSNNPTPIKKGRPTKTSPIQPQVSVSFVKKRDMKTESKQVGKLGGKLGSSKLSKEKKPQQPEHSEVSKPQKYQKKEHIGLGFSAAPIKSYEKKKDKINALFGMKNPFDKFKKNKTLIATPSKFEIRTEPQPVKRGRGRPRKDMDSDQAQISKTGIRDKLKNAKDGAQPLQKVGRPAKDVQLHQSSKKIDRAQVKKMKEAIFKAKLQAKIQKHKEKERIIKEAKKLKKLNKQRKQDEKKAQLRAYKVAKKMVKLEKLEKLKALIKIKKEKAKQKKLKAQSTAKKTTDGKRGRPKKTLTVKPAKKGNEKKVTKLVGQKRPYIKLGKSSEGEKGKKGKK